MSVKAGAIWFVAGALFFWAVQLGYELIDTEKPDFGREGRVAKTPFLPEIQSNDTVVIVDTNVTSSTGDSGVPIAQQPSENATTGVDPVQPTPTPMPDAEQPAPPPPVMPMRPPPDARHVVVAHFNEDVDYLSRFVAAGIPVTVYTRNDWQFPMGVKSRRIPNTGSEAHGYVQFIFDEWDNLPDHIVFIHAHERSSHQLGSIVDVVLGLNWDSDYKSINDHGLGNTAGVYAKYNIQHIHLRYLRLAWDVHPVFKNQLGPLPAFLCYWCCAQFVTSRDAIRRIPLHFWNESREVFSGPVRDGEINDNQKPGFWTGRVFEWIWTWLLTGKTCDEDLHPVQKPDMFRRRRR